MQTKTNELKQIAAIAAENFVPYFTYNSNIYVHYKNETVQISDLEHIKELLNG